MVAALPTATAPAQAPAYEVCVPLAAFGPAGAATWAAAEAKLRAELVLMGWHPDKIHMIRVEATPAVLWAQVKAGARLASDLSEAELARAGLGPDLMPLPGNAHGAAFAEARGDAWRWPPDGVAVEGADYRDILEIQAGVAVGAAQALRFKRARAQVAA